MIVDIQQGTKEWTYWRKCGIGASDAPTIEGISPYRTMLDLYREKAEGEEQDTSASDFIFAKGHKVEGLIRKEFQDLVQAEINPVCMQHDAFDYVRASLDGFHQTHGVLEAKLVGQETLAEARDGGLPAHHYSQMQHQFAVSGADIGQWFGHDGKKNGVLLEVRANPEYIKRLLDLEHLFWDRVVTKNAPPLTDRDYLVPTDLSVLEQLRDAKEFAENAQAAFELAKEHAVNTYGHPKIKGAGIKLFKVTREGALSLPKIPEIASAIKDAQAALDAAYVESFRSKPIESWTVQIEKPKKVGE